MVEDNLEKRAKKAVLKIEKSVTGIYNVLTDFNLKLCHIIERMRDQYGMEGNSYYSEL